MVPRGAVQATLTYSRILGRLWCGSTLHAHLTIFLQRNKKSRPTTDRVLDSNSLINGPRSEEHTSELQSQ